jgi:GH25 family lysozyme M1 (1,4-beta-N-acetylmuramidase)
MTYRLNRLTMMGGAAVAALVATLAFTASPAAAAPSGTQGQDVSGYQGSVNWTAQWNAGSRFAYIKATEGTYYTNPSFAQQYNGSYNVGMIRGSYHFARPDTTSGATQADYFVAHGGGWSKDGKTLPGALDIEYNPYGAECYGLSQASMRSWITSFSNEYHAKTTRWPVLYTTTDWWNTCIGNYNAWSGNSPLWIARYASAVGALPPGYSVYSFWQWTSSGPFAGDSDVWNGTLARLKVLACNGTC